MKSANAETREKLQKSSSYHKVLLRLHALSGINCMMVCNLFCKHVTSKRTMHEHLQQLLSDVDVAKEEK